jgi:hypothetical protein
MTTFATPPTKTLSFVLLNQDEGTDVTNFLPQLAAAANEGLAIFSQFHGGSYTVRAGTSPSDRQPGEIAVNIRKAVATDPSGALGWHQVTNGVPDVELPFDTMSGLTGDSNALDVVATHEIFETSGDPGANQLADNLNGKVSAKETCDRVEDVTFIGVDSWRRRSVRLLHRSRLATRRGQPGHDDPWWLRHRGRFAEPHGHHAPSKAHRPRSEGLRGWPRQAQGGQVQPDVTPDLARHAEDHSRADRTRPSAMMNFEEARKALHEAAADLDALRAQASEDAGRKAETVVMHAWEIALQRFHTACAAYVNFSDMM